ncbi:MAG: alpha/beta hydrolase [Candidatus Acidiferrum sp.]
MQNENAANVSRRSGRLKRWAKGIFLAILLFVVVAGIVGASYQAIENSADARRFPQQGTSVSLGPSFNNLTLNLDCRGQGGPTVILDSGLGVPAIGWNTVQSETAKFTRVCSYDRAGYGWSSASSAPRTSMQIVKELHALLEDAHEKGPYILVGHSFGGFNVRVFNGQYPAEVVGMVLVDASHEDQVSRMSPAIQAYMKKSNEDLKRQEKLAPLLIRFGIARFSQRNQGGSPGVSKEFGQEMLYLELQPKFIEAAASEMTLFDESANEVRAAGNLGDKPLIVLTAGKLVPASQLPPGFPKKDFDDFHEIWVNDLQMKEAHLSTRGKRILVADSDHMIPFERPDTIVAAIREVSDAVNGASTVNAEHSNKPGSSK